MEGLSSRVGRVAAVCHTGPITLIGTSDDGQVPGNRCLAAKKRGDLDGGVMGDSSGRKKYAAQLSLDWVHLGPPSLSWRWTPKDLEGATGEASSNAFDLRTFTTPSQTRSPHPLDHSLYLRRAYITRDNQDPSFESIEKAPRLISCRFEVLAASSRICSGGEVCHGEQLYRLDSAAYVETVGDNCYNKE